VAGTELQGRLRSVGSDTMDNMLALWETAFRKFHPRLRVLHQGKGSSTAIPALVEGSADIGPMSRSLKPDEIAAFKERYGYEPIQIRVALDALGIYVHPSNPIAQRGLTLQELDALFSSTRRLGAPQDITRWGQLGLTGEWANAPVHLYGRNSASGTYGFFQDVALGRGAYKPDVNEQVGSAEVVDEVAHDRYGIGYSGIGYRTNGVATVPLRQDADSPAYEATEANAIDGDYPLARSLYLALNVSPAAALGDLQREFVAFALSREGQALVAQDGYFPVSAAVATSELAKLAPKSGSTTATNASAPVSTELAALGSYQPHATLMGRMRSVGSDTMDNMLALWEQAFRGYHDRLRVLHQGKGSSTAIPALIEGSADIGPMSRLLKPDEVSAFRERFGHDPVQLRVAVDALAVYVHPDNPLLKTGLTLQQLDAIFSSTLNREGAPTATWGDLGIEGEWAEAPIEVFSRNSASGTYGTFMDIVLAGGKFKQSNHELPSSEAVVDAVARNRFAIGYSGIGYLTPNVRALPLATEADLPFAAPTSANAFAGTYPLTRGLYLAVNFDPTTGLDELTREFIRFVYSTEGQAIVAQDGYFPVSPEIKQSELQKVQLTD